MADEVEVLMEDRVMPREKKSIGAESVLVDLAGAAPALT